MQTLFGRSGSRAPVHTEHVWTQGFERWRPYRVRLNAGVRPPRPYTVRADAGLLSPPVTQLAQALADPKRK
jgi:hypothetical protein